MGLFGVGCEVSTTLIIGKSMTFELDYFIVTLAFDPSMNYVSKVINDPFSTYL
jgi:hypothetical protein